jgi:hypothetical protein
MIASPQGPRRSTNHFRLWVLLLAFSAVAIPSFSQQAGSDEYRLKAAFLFRFPQFVEWPAAALDGRNAVEICVSRPNPFGRALDDLVAGETLNGRPLVVREIAGPAVLDGCQVLFVPAAASTSTRLLQAAAARPLLTVGESPQFLDQGGIINLRILERRVRFEVNADAAQRAGLRLSPQLLRLAIAVRGAGG